MAMLTDVIMGNAHRNIMDLLNLFLQAILEIQKEIRDAQTYNAITEDWRKLTEAVQKYKSELEQNGTPSSDCPVDIDVRDIWQDQYTQALLTKEFQKSHPPIAHTWVQTPNGMALFTDALARNRVNDIKMAFLKTQSINARMTLNDLKRANTGMELTVVKNISPTSLQRVEQVCKAHMFEFAAQSDEAGNYNVYFPTNKMNANRQLAAELEKAMIMGSHGIGAAVKNLMHIQKNAVETVARATAKSSEATKQALAEQKGKDAIQGLKEFGDVIYTIDLADPSKYIITTPESVTFCHTQTQIDGSTRMFRESVSHDDAAVKMKAALNSMKMPKEIKGYEWCTWCIQNKGAPASFYDADTLMDFAKQGYQIKKDQLNVETLKVISKTLTPEAEKELQNMFKQQLKEKASKADMDKEDHFELLQQISRLKPNNLSEIMKTGSDVRTIEEFKQTPLSWNALTINEALSATVQKLIGIENRVDVALSQFTVSEIQKLTPAQVQTVLQSAGIKGALATQIAENYIDEIKSADLDISKYRETIAQSSHTIAHSIGDEVLDNPEIPASGDPTINAAIEQAMARQAMADKAIESKDTAI